MCRDSFIYVAWLIHRCDMTHSYMRHDSFIHVLWLIHICGMTYPYVWYDLSVTYSFVCDMTHSYESGGAISVAWLIHMCHMTHSYESHDLCVTYSYVCDMLIHTWVRWSHACGMTQSYVSHHFRMTYLYVCDTYVWHICMCVTWLVPHVRHVELATWLVHMSQAEPCLWHDSIIWITSLVCNIFVCSWQDAFTCDIRS